MGNLSSWFWVSIVAGLLNLPAFHSLHHQGELFNITLADSSFIAINKWLGQFSCFHAFRVSTHTPGSSGQLYCVAQGRCRGHASAAIGEGKGQLSCT